VKIVQFFLFFFVGITGLFADQSHFLTFIIPCYNCEKYIEESVESIYKQRLNIPFEIICTDDGSKDQTFEILTSLAAIHPEMKIIKHDKNCGGGAARNTCVKHSSGDLIFCLDSDNVLIEDSIQQLIDEFDNFDCDIICFERLLNFSGNKKIGRIDQYSTLNGRYSFKDIFETDAYFPGWSGNYLYSRKSFDEAGGYETKYGSLDTFTLGFKQLLKGFKIKYVTGTAYYHRVGIDSYFMREYKSNVFNRFAYEFLLEYKQVFNANTITRLEICLKQLLRGKEAPFMPDTFMNKKNLLNPAYRY